MVFKLYSHHKVGVVVNKCRFNKNIDKILSRLIHMASHFWILHPSLPDLKKQWDYVVDSAISLKYTV